MALPPATFDWLSVRSPGLNMLWRASKPYCGHLGAGCACAGMAASIVSPATKALAQSIRPPQVTRKNTSSKNVPRRRGALIVGLIWFFILVVLFVVELVLEVERRFCL